MVPSLTKYNKQLVDTYLSIPYVETKCGYACSDQYVWCRTSHVQCSFSRYSASWSKAGYPSIFTIGKMTFTWMYASCSSYYRVFIRKCQPQQHPLEQRVSSCTDPSIVTDFFPSRIDISTEFSFDHMLEFSKLAVAFAMELSTI